MPYGILDPERLSKASRISMERAIDWWQKSMLTSKHKTYFVLAGYDSDQGQEIKLRRAIIEETVHEPELLANLVEVSARNETSLAQKIARVRALLPVERSEERRVGKECRSRWPPYDQKKNRELTRG